MCFSTFSPQRKSLNDVYRLDLIYLQHKHAKEAILIPKAAIMV